jgi:predicted nucleic acid-binding protein
MTSGALICDTGALLDYLVATAPDHRAFCDAIDRARARYVPALVLAEVDYFLRKDRDAMSALMRDLARGAFTYAAPSIEMLERAMAVDRQYRDLGLGLVDASIVALAEHVGVTRLATRDVRHFSAVALRGGKHFELVVQPRRPDPSR